MSIRHLFIIFFLSTSFGINAFDTPGHGGGGGGGVSDGDGYDYNYDDGAGDEKDSPELGPQGPYTHGALPTIHSSGNGSGVFDGDGYNDNYDSGASDEKGSPEFGPQGPYAHSDLSSIHSSSDGGGGFGGDDDNDTDTVEAPTLTPKMESRIQKLQARADALLARKGSTLTPSGQQKTERNIQRYLAKTHRAKRKELTQEMRDAMVPLASVKPPQRSIWLKRLWELITGREGDFAPVGDNFHTIEPKKAYRSGTMPIRNLARKIRKYKIKTVINLRGAMPHKRWWRRENSFLKKLGINFYNVHMSARTLPSKENLLTLLDIFKHAPRPVLIHCQAGADRTGEAAALWQLTQQKLSKRKALRQLSTSYGHISQRYPAKRFFIKQWKGASWARRKYHPELLGKYAKPRSKQ